MKEGRREGHREGGSYVSEYVEFVDQMVLESIRLLNDEWVN